MEILGNKSSEEHITIETALPYYGVLFLFSHIWLLYYIPPFIGPLGILSFLMQQVFLFSSAVVIDAKCGRIVRYLTAGTALWYTIQILICALILSVMGINVSESVDILMRGDLSSDFFFMLHEAGFSIKASLGIMILLCDIFIIGIVVRRYLKTVRISAFTVHRVLPSVALMCLSVFILEQALTWQSPGLFSRRVIPSYIELFRQNNHSLTLQFPPPVPELVMQQRLDAIGPPVRKKNVVVFVLESFRHDIVDPVITPNLKTLEAQSLMFDSAYCDAIYTSLSWNVLFMDLPAYTISRDIEDASTGGSVILRIMKKAGYTTHFAGSAYFGWNGYYGRFSGNGTLLDSYYSAYDNLPGADRNDLDRATAASAVSLIRSFRKGDRPYLLYVQLDSSHFTYFFDRDAELFKPYPRSVGIVDVRKEHYINHLFNRYKNSARNVDNRIGEIIGAIKESGDYDNTVIAVVSDHGEGFAPGMIGHHVFHDEIKKLLMMIRLPGIAPARSKRRVSHRDMFPTIFDYLGIRGLRRDLLLGRSALRDTERDRAVLIMHGSESLAELNMEGISILFRTATRPESITFTPCGITDYHGTHVEFGINNSNWKETLKRIIEQRDNAKTWR